MTEYTSDDIVCCMIKIIEEDIESRSNYKLYNIGNNKPEKLEDFINVIETCLNKKAIKKYYPMQPGDVPKTFADISSLIKDYNYKPNTNINNGINSFISWFKKYHNIN